MESVRQPMPQVIRRLGFVAVLFRQAEDQASKPYPLSASAVLALHDVIELYLGALCDHLGIDADPKTEFLGYWKLIDKAAPDGSNLGQKGAMSRLNGLRVAFKHHGVIPSEDAIDQSVREARTFLAANTESLIGVDFDNIDLISLVPYETTRNLLEAAVRYRELGQTEDALAAIAIAFDQLTSDFARRNTQGRLRNAYEFGGRLQKVREHNPRAGGGKDPLGPAVHDIEKLANALTDAVEYARVTLRVIALGFDFPSYARFAARTPVVSYTMGGGISTQRLTSEDEDATDSDITFCTDFVISSALRLAQSEVGMPEKRHTLNDPSARLTVRHFKSLDAVSSPKEAPDGDASH